MVSEMELPIDTTIIRATRHVQSSYSLRLTDEIIGRTIEDSLLSICRKADTLSTRSPFGKEMQLMHF